MNITSLQTLDSIEPIVLYADSEPNALPKVSFS